MKQVIIRDDDISFFTPPELLDTLYGSLLASNVPVAVSVIPAITCGVSVGEGNGPFWTRYRLDYSPFIPPAFRHNKETFPVTENLSHTFGRILVTRSCNMGSTTSKPAIFLSAWRQILLRLSRK